MRARPKGTISQFQISHLLGEAYGRTTSCGIAMNGFEKSEI
jgi:hypothetical protein